MNISATIFCILILFSIIFAKRSSIFHNFGDEKLNGTCLQCQLAEARKFSVIIHSNKTAQSDLARILHESENQVFLIFSSIRQMQISKSTLITHFSLNRIIWFINKPKDIEVEALKWFWTSKLNVIIAYSRPKIFNRSMESEIQEIFTKFAGIARNNIKIIAQIQIKYEWIWSVFRHVNANCAGTKFRIKQFDICDQNSTEANSDEKLQNCSINILSSFSVPYFYYVENNRKSLGPEYYFIQTLVERLNFNLIHSYESRSDLNYWPTRSDIIIGGLRYGKISENYISTIPYLSDDLTWCVQTAQPVPRGLTIFRAFKNFNMIFGLLACFFLISLLIYFMSGFDGSHLDAVKSMVIVFQVTLCSAIAFKTESIVGNLVFVLCHLSNVVLSNIYLCKLTSFITIPLLYYQVRHYHEIINNNFQLTGSNSSLQYLIDRSGVHTFLFKYTSENG